MKPQREIETAGFYFAALLCLILAVVKLTTGVPWSWWRVMLPLWAVAGHAVLYLGVGWLWLTLVGSERASTRELRHREVHQLGAMLCLLVFVDNLLRRIGPGETAWGWLAPGRTEVLVLFRLLAVGSQLWYWWRVIEAPDKRGQTGNGVRR